MRDTYDVETRTRLLWQELERETCVHRRRMLARKIGDLWGREALEKITREIDRMLVTERMRPRFAL